MTPPKRSKSPELEGYPGLGVRPWGTYFIEHPRTRRQASLKTKSLDKAKKLWAIMQQKWDSEIAEAAADTLLNKLDALEQEQQRKIPTVAEFAKEWRQGWLGVEVWQQGLRQRFNYSDCKVLSKKGKTLSQNTVKDYAGYIVNKYEPSALLQKTLLTDKRLGQKLREFLSDWSQKPTTYNHHLACLSKIMQQAVMDGLIEANPCRDIPLAVIPRKTRDQIEAQYIDDQAYAAITQAMMVDTQSGKKHDGEWQARLVDLMLFMSSRPGDAIKVRDDDFDESGQLKYETSKTAELIWVEDETGELAATVKWFREWKKANSIISPYLCVQPKYKRYGVAGQPVTVKYLSRKFSDAVKAAGYAPGTWTLRLIRHKGLTDEAAKDLANNKGGHRTQSARDKYRVQAIPTRVKNTLVNPRNAVTKIEVQ